MTIDTTKEAGNIGAYYDYSKHYQQVVDAFANAPEYIQSMLETFTNRIGYLQFSDTGPICEDFSFDVLPLNHIYYEIPLAELLTLIQVASFNVDLANELCKTIIEDYAVPICD